MVLAVVLNALPFYLRRIGVIDPVAYGQELARFCSGPIQHWWLPASCHAYRLVNTVPRQLLRIDPTRLYQITPAEFPLKLAKFGLEAGLLLFSVLLILRLQEPGPGWRSLRPWLPLQFAVLVALVMGLVHSGSVSTLAGALGLLWVPLVPLCGWLTTSRRLQMLADAMAALILLNLPIQVIEAMRGLPLPFGSGGWVRTGWPGRLGGLLTLPNTLGVFLVMALAFCLAFSRRPWHRRLVWVVVPQLLLARSGSGLVGLGLLLGLPGLLRILPDRRRLTLLLGGAMALLLFLSLPLVLGRPDAFESVAGRGRTLYFAVQTATWPERVFGRGLGSSGVLVQRMQETLSSLPSQAGSSPAPEKLRPTDSLVVLLICQGGLLALAAFSGLILWCIRRDAQGRTFLVLLLFCGLTLNVTEVFPLGILLAVVLHRSLQPPDPLGP